MVYKGNIPQPTDKLSASQPELLENYGQLGLLFAIDHASLTDATVANRGKHDQATLLHKAANPSTAAGEGMVYTVKDGTTQYLRYREESDGTVHNLIGGGSGSIFAWGNIQTKHPVVILSSHNVASAALHWPSGTNATVSVVFTTPAANTNYVVMLTPFNTGATNSLTMSVNKTVNGFDYYAIYNPSQASLGVGFIVIGG